ncbi:MAG: glycosyltransferase [Ruminococcaceae bacterium]|nr:glycosyltransferase [Oscillospiraceae bacterium]
MKTLSHPKVSIIIPVYNVEQYIDRCISSLKAQTLKNIEIILVDDSSTDSSLRICKNAENEDSRIKVIHKENEGAGLARNSALKIASGTYIGFVDSDDYVDPEMFEVLCAKAEQYNADLVLSGVKFVDGNMFSQQGDCVLKNYFENDTCFESEDELKKLRMGIIGSLPSDKDDSKYGMSIWKNLFKRSIIEENNLSFVSEREMLSEDALFMVDYISCIKRAVGVKEAFYNYCRNGQSISKSYKIDRFEKSLVFVNEVERRFKKDIESNIYQIYIDRFWQAMCRVICSQEIMHSSETNSSFSNLKERLAVICSHSLTVRVFKEYPLSTLPFKQRLFAYCIKCKFYRLLRLLVNIRSK